MNNKSFTRYLYISVFFSGMTSLAIEMAASRLLGNVFGTSNLVWASIIGLILIYLAAGYFLGGYWADKAKTPRTFYLILFWAAISIALIPIVSRPVLRLASNAFDQLQLGVLLGSFTSVLILFLVPVILLGTASPFAISLTIKNNPKIGKVSGNIYAISTLGSFIGTFLPVLVLIPTIGTYRTFLVFSGLLLIISLIGLLLCNGLKKNLALIWTPVLIPVLLIWGLPGSLKATPNQIFETESAYNYIQVLDQDNYILLRLNEGQGVHSIYHPLQDNYFGSWEQVLIAPYFNPIPYKTGEIKSLAILGLAAGTTARQASLVYENIKIDGYEIDPEIVEVGKKYFAMDMPNLDVFVQDGRVGLENSTEKYQIISVDAYRPPYIPWHLTTKEFFEIVNEHLTEDGVMVINVGRGPTDRRLINALGTTILSVFPTIHVVDIPNTFNSIIFATKQPTLDSNLAKNYDYLLHQETVPSLLLETMQTSVANIQPGIEQSVVFTDDKAPIEWITNALVLDFIFSDEMETLQ